MLPMNNISLGATAQTAGANAETLTGAALNSELETTWLSYKERVIELDSKLTQEIATSEENEPVAATVSDLLAMMLLIITAARELRNQVSESRIEVAAAVQALASRIADKKESDSVTKFAINLAAQVGSMVISTGSTIRMSMPKTVQDKHVSGMTDGRSTRVSDLTPKEKTDFSIQLQEQRTAKYSAVSRMGEMASTMVGSGNEMQYAGGVNEQEQAQSNQELLAKQTPQLEEFMNALGQELARLNEILQAITQANAANNR